MRNELRPVLAARLMLTLTTLVYVIALPWLELGDTHVWNPEWPPHARLHEVWQLATNGMIGLYALWCLWGRGDLLLPALLNGFVMGGFLLAYLLRNEYGGSMSLFQGGSETLLLGINLGLFGASLVLGLSLAALMWEGWRRRRRFSK